MGRKKKHTKDEANEPLSAFQDTAKTGRTEASGLPSDPPTPPRKAIAISSAELVDQMFCNYKYKHTVGPNTTNSVATKSEVPVHHDLVACFRKLDGHLALICEEIDEKMIGPSMADSKYSEEATATIAKFLVTKVSLESAGDTHVVVLIGTKELSTGETIKLETPKKAVDAGYPYATELTVVLDELITEVEQYMTGEKQAETNQLQMEFEPNHSLVEEEL